jgi:hypothetical protein
MFYEEFHYQDENSYNETSPYRTICGYFDGFRVEVCSPSDKVIVREDGVKIHLNIQGLVYSGYKSVSTAIAQLVLFLLLSLIDP